MTFCDHESKLEIDSCPECFGLWFDSEELKSFFESPSLSTRVLGDEAALAPAERLHSLENDPSPRLCPACQEPMFDSRLGTTCVDYCLSCRGIWLDRYELETLVTAFWSGERGNLLIVNQLIEGLGTSHRPNPKARVFLEALSRYRESLQFAQGEPE